jgi:O-6-methylguanine DNA methyltransferase
MDGKFQEAVLNLVKQIPKGKVTTYGEIARKITGSFRAARAVAQAVAKNPYPVIIPCHRVVRSNGDVGGYSLGVEKKIGLLRAEGIEIKGRKVVNFEETIFLFEKEEKELRFVTDRMLGKLSTWLRVLGHDTVYAGDINIEKESVEGDEDENKALIALAEHEARILLTRDKNLASSARKRGVQCIQIKTDEMMEQLKELLRHSININLVPVPVRCSECNARIRKVEEGEEDILREKSYVPTSMIGEWDFWVCEHCGRIYWEGSHWRNMRERLRQNLFLKRKALPKE